MRTVFSVLALCALLTCGCKETGTAPYPEYYVNGTFDFLQSTTGSGELALAESNRNISGTFTSWKKVNLTGTKSQTVKDGPWEIRLRTDYFYWPSDNKLGYAEFSLKFNSPDVLTGNYMGYNATSPAELRFTSSITANKRK